MAQQKRATAAKKSSTGRSLRAEVTPKALSSRSARTKRSVRSRSGKGATQVFALNRREVAAISGTALAAVDKAIEQHVLPRFQVKNETFIEPEGVVLMAILGHVKMDLPVKLKQQVRNWVIHERPHTKKSVQELKVTPVVAIRCPLEVRKRAQEAEEYLRLRERFIETNSEIRGGEPVIAGTRIPVHGVAKRIDMGDMIEELIEDYPHVPREAFEIAVRYAAAHPRRGRPVKPWRKQRKAAAASRA